MNNQISPQEVFSQTTGAQDPLSQLRDIHLPDPVSWWPPAPGWWILAVIVVTTLFFLSRWLIKRRANNCYRREAIQQFNGIVTNTNSLEPSDLEPNNLEKCQALLTLLRRTAKTAYPQLSLESEVTAPMLARLNHCCKQTVFDDSLQKSLGQLLYQATPNISDDLLQQLQQGTEQWIKKHKTKYDHQVSGENANANL